MRNKWFSGLVADLAMVSLAFIITVRLKPGPDYPYYHNYYKSFLIFLAIWILVSALFGKHRLRNHERHSVFVRQVLMSNIVIFSLVSGLMYLVREDYYSRFIVIGTVLIATAAELIAGSLWYSFLHAQLRHENGHAGSLDYKGQSSAVHAKLQHQHYKRHIPKPRLKHRQDALLLEISKPVFDFIFQYAPIDSPGTLIVSTNSRFNIDMQLQPEFDAIVNLERINDIRYLNKFFETVNSKLCVGGFFVDFVETKDLRKKRLLDKFPFGLNYLYYTADFIVKRVFPKFAPTKGLYFLLTRGQNRVLSQAETFGRLYSCGFTIVDERFINGYLYFVAMKAKEPLFPSNPSYGPLIALDRIGKGGKPIKVYKMRTMHPFAEYLQEYIYQRTGLENGGKFRDDFRISTLGKFLRTFWLDELPMLVNLIRGELKLFGVRPLSRHYFELYSKELQEKRTKYKPGLIPPFYVDNPGTLQEIMASEMKYLDAYEKHPFLTDWKYFWIAFHNILFRRYRSR
jgi:lipopolysaccharide/colanic/teichoic acid biosynthesis glycosyltransferase